MFGMTHDKILREIYNRKIIAIVRGVPLNKMEQTMQALLDGGVRMAEITYDHTDSSTRGDTLVAMKQIRKTFGSRLFLGAGTVLTEQDVEDAREAGADYIISPNVNVQVIKRTRSLDMVSMPGAFSPSEIVTAYESGADIVKLFPAALLGISYIKALQGPLHHIPMSAVGGVTPESVPDFVRAGVSCFGIGGNLVSAEKVRMGDFTGIAEAARRFSGAAVMC